MIRYLILCCALLVVGCQKQEHPEPATGPTVEQAFDALQRYYNVNQLCFDSIQGFLGHFPENGEAGYVDDENHDHGWFVSNHYKFYQLSNGTWFITAPDNGTVHDVSPDVSNLQCRMITIQ